MQKIKYLKKKVQELELDVKAIIQEHDLYTLGGNEQKIAEWFYSFPIETLGESLDKDWKKLPKRMRLCDLKHKFALRKLHDKKKIELEKVQIELNIAEIDEILKKIEKVKI